LSFTEQAVREFKGWEGAVAGRAIGRRARISAKWPREPNDGHPQVEITVPAPGCRWTLSLP